MRVPRFSSGIWMAGVLAGLFGGMSTTTTLGKHGLFLGLAVYVVLLVLAPRAWRQKRIQQWLSLGGFLSGNALALSAVAAEGIMVPIGVIVSTLLVFGVNALLSELENK